ncbi:MAG: AarF/ABC1/UbiB kinase family protein [Cyanobacteriota bacterium]|nr:AarF/ABC1/UbiB kinase family protein [Cyanobacteriota bacterium]
MTLAPDFAWEQATRSPWRRQGQIIGFLLGLSLGILWERLWGRPSSLRRQRQAEGVVKGLLHLGPTFIKIGQSLSTRADLLPREYIQALSQLQDQVPPFPSATALALVEQELGSSLGEFFQSFEPEPLASASLGQVHRACLLSGEEVVVKVQRPGLEALFNLDFTVLQTTLRWSRRYLPGFRRFAQKYDLEAIYQEFFTLLFQEIDYINEGQNAERFRKNFSDDPQIKAPQVYWDYTTHRILTLEYLPGIKVNDRASLEAAGINLDQVIQTGICAYLKQLLVDGFFQSDPHPGNMAVAGDGVLIFYDFGTMAEVKTIAQGQMLQTFFAILKKDANQVLETLIYMGLIEPVADMSAVKRIIYFLLDNFRDKPVDIRAFEQVGDEVYTLFRQQPFRLPPQMTFIIKSITTLDGIARALDPQYNLIAASQPFIQSLTLRRPATSWVTTMLQQSRSFLIQSVQNWATRRSSLQDLEEKLERGALQFPVRSPETERLLQKIHLALQCLLYACLTGFSLLSAVLFLGTPYPQAALAGFGLTGLFSLFLIRAWLRMSWRERMDRWVAK